MPPKLCIRLPTSSGMLHLSCIGAVGIFAHPLRQQAPQATSQAEKLSPTHPPLYIKLHLHSATGVHGMILHLRTGHKHHNRTPDRNAHNRSNTNPRTIFTYELCSSYLRCNHKTAATPNVSFSLMVIIHAMQLSASTFVQTQLTRSNYVRSIFNMLQTTNTVKA